MLLSNTVWEELDPSMRQQLQPMISDPGSSAAPIPHRILNLDARPPDE